MIARPMRHEHRQTCYRKHHDGAGCQRRERARKQNFAHRIVGHHPLARRRSAGEQHGRDDHHQNAGGYVIGTTGNPLEVARCGDRSGRNVGLPLSAAIVHSQPAREPRRRACRRPGVVLPRFALGCRPAICNRAPLASAPRPLSAKLTWRAQSLGFRETAMCA